MVRRTRVKICGITRLEDALFAEAEGVDALGFVFVPQSARSIAVADARDMAARLGPFITCAGLFLDAEAAMVDSVLAAMPALVPQFHGRETPDYCDAFGRPYLKAIGVAGGLPTAAELAAFRHAAGFLFDSNVPGELGGTGHRFDWQSLVDGTDNHSRALILAGGLSPDNVSDGINQVAPYAVDVSTGVESAKGIKDHQRVRQFMQAVREGDALANGLANQRTATS